MNILWILAKIIYKFQIPAVKNSKVHRNAKICTGAVVNNCFIDRYSFVGPFSQVQWCKIGAFCSIARGVIIGPAEHPIDYLSTSPVFLKGRNCLRKHFAYKEFQPCKETYIGNDVWIGMNACIKSGVTIGDGAIVGMGAVVTKDVGPYEIWGGTGKVN